MSSKLVENIENMAPDSKATLIEHLADRVEYVRFFSYGSNMNKKKFKDDMKEKARKIKLKLSKKDKTKLELDKLATRRVLLNFNRELSNESQQHGRAFSICLSLGSRVEGICHDIHVSVLPAFLKKEGLLLSEPSYKIIKVCVSGEDQEVLTLLGLKPKPIEKLDLTEIQNALKYIEQSVEGAKDFGVEHSDMIKVKKSLREMKRQFERSRP